MQNEPTAAPQTTDTDSGPGRGGPGSRPRRHLVRFYRSEIPTAQTLFVWQS